MNGTKTKLIAASNKGAVEKNGAKRAGYAPANLAEKNNRIGQAGVLAQERSKPAANYTSELTEKNKPDHKAKKRDYGWRELADFFVSFGYALTQEGKESLQTKVHHSQTGQSDCWEGLTTYQMLKWMRGQIPSEPLAEAKAGTKPCHMPPPLVDATPAFELADLKLSLIRAPLVLDGQRLPGLLRAEGQLTLSVPDSNQLASDQLPFVTEVYLVNLQSGLPELVASEQGQLSLDDLSHEFALKFSAPAAGRYRLYATARLLPPNNAFVQTPGPTMRVEP